MYLLRNLDLKELVQQNSNHNLLGLAVICVKTENSTKNVESNTSAYLAEKRRKGCLSMRRHLAGPWAGPMTVTSMLQHTDI